MSCLMIALKEVKKGQYWNLDDEFNSFFTSNLEMPTISSPEKI